jgi:hypothetical protein
MSPAAPLMSCKKRTPRTSLWTFRCWLVVACCEVNELREKNTEDYFAELFQSFQHPNFQMAFTD